MSSQSIPMVFPGNVCPVSVNYGKVHGTSAPTCTIIYEDDGTGSQNNPANPPYTIPPGFPGSQPTTPIAPTVSGAPARSLGDPASIQIDNSVFNGFVVKREVTQPESTGVGVLKVTLVDWRDILHDHIFFGGYNVQEANGTHWHLLPENWSKQRKTFVSKELDQLDFVAVQDTNAAVPNLINTVGSKGLLSGATILNSICEWCNQQRFFTSLRWTADSIATNVLKTSRPMNLDFTGGAPISAVIQQVLDICNLRFTCVKKDELRITLKGQTNHTTIQAFMNGQTNLCGFDDEHLDEGTFGDELQDKGKYVLVVGERNLHQFTFPLKICWNKIWDHKFRYNINVNGLLNAKSLCGVLYNGSLTGLNLMEDLPTQYHDKEFWMLSGGMYGAGAMPLHRDRTKMTISDYLNKIPYKSFVVDFGHVITQFTPDSTAPSAEYREFDQEELKAIEEREDTSRRGTGSRRGPNGGLLTPVDAKNYANDYDIMDLNSVKNSRWPLANRLVSESNVSAVVHATYRRLAFDAGQPIQQQRYFVAMVEGFTMETEEIIDNTECQMEYRVRVMFNDIRCIIDPKEAERGPVELRKAIESDTWVPDRMLITLTLQGNVFTFTKGDNTGVKVRTQKRQVKNLFRGFVDGVEKMILAENFSIDLKEQGVMPAARPVTAYQVATKIADQLLFSLLVSNAGSLKFEDKAGYEPDGLIETVNVSFGDESGIIETISFSTSFLEHQVFTPYLLKESTKLITEADRARETNKVILEHLKTTGNKFQQAVNADSKLEDQYRAIAAGETFNMLFGGNGDKGTHVTVKFDTTGVNTFDPKPFEIVVVKDRDKPTPPAPTPEPTPEP